MFARILSKSKKINFLTKIGRKRSLKYCKVAYVGHIGKKVRNDFDHQKKCQDLFFIKGNLSWLLINYRSLRIK